MPSSSAVSTISRATRLPMPPPNVSQVPSVISETWRSDDPSCRYLIGSNSMETRELGRSGVAVTRVVLGCGNFGGVGSSPAFFGQGIPHDVAFRIMDEAWDLGIRAFDTADAYGGGRSESWIGEWLAGKGSDIRDALVVETKT